MSGRGQTEGLVGEQAKDPVEEGTDELVVEDRARRGHVGDERAEERVHGRAEGEVENLVEGRTEDLVQERAREHAEKGHEDPVEGALRAAPKSMAAEAREDPVHERAPERIKE